MLIEVSVEGARTLVNMETVIGVTEDGEDKIEIYTPTGVIVVDSSYDAFVKLIDPDNRKIER